VTVRSSERSASYVLNYVLTLGITAILVSVLFIGGGSYVEQQRERTVESQLTVVAHHVAADIEQADRLVVAGESTDHVRVDRTLPGRASGTTYTVELDPTEEQLWVNATSVDVTVSVPLNSQTALGASTVEGGSVVVVYDGSRLVIEDA